MARELKPRSLGVGVARCRPLPRALQAMSRKRHDVRLWIFVRRCRGGRTDLGLQNSSFVDRKTDSQSVGLSLNGTPLRIATLQVTHSKDERGPESGFRILSNLFILNNMAERVGFEPTLEFPLNTLSKRAPSATRPSLRRDNGLRHKPSKKVARLCLRGL
jgi:hypothetical protein